MSIFRRKTSRGMTREYHYRFCHDGKSFSGTTGCTTEKEARAFEKNVIDRLKQQSSAKGLIENFRDELAGGRRISLTDAWGRFMEYPRKRPMGEQQRREKESYWADFLAFLDSRYPGARLLSDVTKEMAKAYLLQLRTAGRFSRGAFAISNRTINVYHQTCQQLFQDLFDDASLVANPFKGLEKLTNESKSREAFTPEELAQIGAQADAFLYPLFLVGINTGLREGDICLLRWDEVDLVGGWITKSMSKTGKKVRIPILPHLRNHLASIDRDGAFVFPAQANLYQENKDGLSYRITKFLKNLKWQDKNGEDRTITIREDVEGRSRAVVKKDFHSLRHTFCYLAAINSVPQSVIQSVVGHVDPRVTEIYTNHATDAVKAEGLARVPNYLLPAEAVATPLELAIKAMDDATNKDWRQKWEDVKKAMAKS